MAEGREAVIAALRARLEADKDKPKLPEGVENLGALIGRLVEPTPAQKSKSPAILGVRG
jgi:hypothetical protein